jgi:Tol biopolymer transport system component
MVPCTLTRVRTNLSRSFVAALVLISVVPSAAASRDQMASQLIGFERGGALGIGAEIWLMSADGSGQRKLADGCCFDWSPSGEKLAYLASEGVGVASLYVVNVDGSGMRRVTRRGDAESTDYGHYQPPDWSPDGRRLVYLGPNGIYSVQADGTRRRQLTDVRQDESPVWSADGTTIAFERRRAIYRMEADGSDERRLTPGAAGIGSLVWAPNRPTVAFVHFDGSAWHLSVINANGSGFRTLTKGLADHDSPAWSPSGRKIAFISSRGNKVDIHVINRDGSRNRNLTRKARTADWDPAWSPDGQRIAFRRTNLNGDDDIYVMTATGQQQTNITNAPRGTRHNSPEWMPRRP